MKFGSFASLRDALVGREVPCRVRGCAETWLWAKEELAQALERGETQPPKRMCDRCRAYYEASQDIELPCSRRDCSGSFAWSRMSRVEAWVRAGRPAAGPHAPHGLCGACRQATETRTDREVSCRLRGCSGTWTWTARAQQLAANESNDVDPAPPKRLCPTCEHDLRSLSDQPVPCKVRGCNQTWTWTRWSHLEALRNAKDDAPIVAPSRMCESCAARIAQLSDEELPCRVRGCKNTFTFTARARLESQLAGETGPPKRMCASCLERYSKLQDREVACKRPGCKNTWVWKRGAQLGAKRPRPPVRFCDSCEAALGKLSDKKVPCETDGCDGTWTWTRAAQLASGAKKPPHHMCEACAQFLQSAQPKEIPCSRCGRTIHWSKHNQLMTKLGRWVEPSVCGSCKQSGAAATQHGH